MSEKHSLLYRALVAQEGMGDFAEPLIGQDLLLVMAANPKIRLLSGAGRGKTE